LERAQEQFRVVVSVARIETKVTMQDPDVEINRGWGRKEPENGSVSFLCKPLLCNGVKNRLMYLANLSHFVTS